MSTARTTTSAASPTEAAAARAYDAAAREHFGEFARMNFARDGERSAVAVEAETRRAA